MKIHFKDPDHNVLLTVSGNIPETLLDEIETQQRPLTDYVAMSNRFCANLIDYKRASDEAGIIGKALGWIGGNNLKLAWACYKQRGRYSVIFTDGEQVGLPLALLLKFFGLGKRPRHLMIVHILSTRSKASLIDTLKLHTHIDQFLVYSTWQQAYITDRWELPRERVPFTPFMVDRHFFSLAASRSDDDIPGITDDPTPYICSVGLEFRDYPTLMKAVEGLNIRVIIAAGSPWSKREDETQKSDIPDNVVVRRFTQKELRKVYEKSAFMVMPLYENQFQAGVTALLEAMALEKAIICSRTEGQTDVVIDHVSGLYVPAEDPIALHNAIVQLLNDPDQAEEMGRAGRKIIDDEMSLDHYVERLAQHVIEAKQR